MYLAAIPSIIIVGEIKMVLLAVSFSRACVQVFAMPVFHLSFAFELFANGLYRE